MSHRLIVQRYFFRLIKILYVFRYLIYSWETHTCFVSRILSKKTTVFALQKLQCWHCKSYSVSTAKATMLALQKLKCLHCKDYSVSTAKATVIAIHIYKAISRICDKFAKFPLWDRQKCRLDKSHPCVGIYIIHGNKYFVHITMIFLLRKE